MEAVMQTPARIFGHPIHPMLIPFPLALWTFSLIADLLYYFGSHDYVWVNVAFYTLFGGVIGAVLAAIAGIIDYFSIRDRKASRIAAWHARFNVVALFVFGASLYLRTDSGGRVVNGSMTIPVLLSFLGVLLIAVSGWLGGELVYKHHIGVQRGGEAETNEGYPRRVA
jgi:uncharacterized membrane protein